MKSRYRNTLIGAAIAAALSVTGVAIAHGNNNMGGWQQGEHTQPGCDGAGPGMGMGMAGHGMGMMSGMMGKMMGPDNMMGGMRHGMGMGPGPDFSAEQKAEMGKIREEFLPLMGEMLGKMQALHEQMRALHQSDTTDQAAINELADRKGDLMAEMIKLRSQHHAKMQALMTEEQREQMQQRHKGMGMGQMDG